MPTEVAEALDQFVAEYLSAYQTHHGHAPLTDYDPEWPSACCESSPNADQQVSWRPVRQTQAPAIFRGLEEAFECPLHPDFKAFFGRYWSDHLAASSPDGDLDLLMIWNEADFERLRENLVGHALAKFRQKRPLTLFFACPVSDNDYFISLDNTTGEVLLEKPGVEPLRTLAPNLADFLRQLTPRVR